MRGMRPLAGEEVQAVAAWLAAQESWTGKRDRCLFLFGLYTGYRISESLSLTVRDVLTKAGEIRERVKVKSENMKGKKGCRSLPIHPKARRALTEWLAVAAELGVVHQDDPLFPSKRQLSRPMCRQAAYASLKRCFRALGFLRCATHTMRKTFARRTNTTAKRQAAAGEASDALLLTSKALGHKAITSTVAYLSFLEEDVDRVILEAGDVDGEGW